MSEKAVYKSTCPELLAHWVKGRVSLWGGVWPRRAAGGRPQLLGGNGACPLAVKGTEEGGG